MKRFLEENITPRWYRFDIGLLYGERLHLFPFRKQAMPFLPVDPIIGKQAFQSGRYHICFSSGLDKVEIA